MSDDMQALPCGCKMYTVKDAFVFEPHSLECEFYLYFLEQSEKLGKTPTYLEI